MKEAGVTYVPPSDYASSDSSMGPYVPTTQVITRGKRKPFVTNKAAIVLTLVLLLLALAVFGVIFVWVYGVPGQVEEQKAEIHRMAQKIKDQQQEIQRLKGKGQEYVNDGDVCSLELEKGPCMAAMPRWAFNPRNQKCVQFMYGGCKGNGNNFITLHDCQQQCENKARNIEIIPLKQEDAEENPCGLQPSAGPCRSQMPRYYYDGQDGSCKKFLYGGCAGNSNNFVSQGDCESRCSTGPDRMAKLLTNMEENKVRNTCHLEPEVGMCRASIERWYHEPSSGECKTFTWGGCGGNDNNFSTKDKCEATCTGQQADVRSNESDLDPVCKEKKDSGMCRGAFPRFFYNTESGSCENFTFGGCDANGNNFETLEACEAKCKKQ